MRVSDFSFDLPNELIARYPTAERRASRLLQLDSESGECHHRHFSDLLELLRPGDLMVFNDTKVIPARVYGNKETGGKVEMLVERILADNEFLAHVRASKAPKPGSKIKLENDVVLLMLGRQDDLFHLKVEKDPKAEKSLPILEILNEVGHIPLPPYIDRSDELSDRDRYQTVYARHEGAAAAPTAGLHFDDDMLASLKSMGIDVAFVTLHVGAGTFQPVRVDKVEDHVMHSEWINVPENTVQKIGETKKKGGRVVSVGTTSLRSLESAARQRALGPYEGETDIFIYPGYEFQVVDALVTNFHLPESTLLMLVSAFAGHKEILNAYREAVKQKYRFFSYGDAMFLTCKTGGSKHV